MRPIKGQVLAVGFIPMYMDLSEPNHRRWVRVPRWYDGIARFLFGRRWELIVPVGQLVLEIPK